MHTLITTFIKPIKVSIKGGFGSMKPKPEMRVYMQPTAQGDPIAVVSLASCLKQILKVKNVEVTIRRR